MAQQTIDIGTVANDGTGDPLRDAFDKVNDNFNEVYAALGNATTLAALKAALRLPKYEVIARRDALQATANATITYVAWDAEDYDPDGLFTPGNDYITLPGDVTAVEIFAQVLMDFNATGARISRLEQWTSAPAIVNTLGWTYAQAPTGSSLGWRVPLIATRRPVTGGNRIRLGVQQDSGGSLNLTGVSGATQGNTIHVRMYA